MSAPGRLFPGLPFAAAVMRPSGNGERCSIVRAGVPGHWPLYAPDSDAARSQCVVINAALGVTLQQREAMLAGSMFGWHVPGANPINYDASGAIVTQIDTRPPEDYAE